VELELTHGRKKAKRGGGGKYNVGTVNDEVKEGEREGGAPAEGGADAA